MKCPMDLIELNSHAIILHNAMWVIQVEASKFERVLLHLFCFNVYLLHTTDLIERNPQRKSGKKFLLILLQSSCQSCWDMALYSLHDKYVQGKLWQNMWRLLHTEHSDESDKRWGIPIYNASITSFDMQGGSCLNINLYTGVTKWSDNHMITTLELHLDNNLKYVFTTVSVNYHSHSNLGNSCRAQTTSRM